ncbi:PRD domain-containing protein [Pectobacterium fontis]|uniref:PRD domain-containing protein n=1 Tax=Pectobacterium fontis TaxID=2558042 RepID=UPI000A691E90|nr:PRD domain-containing protein [Pectobacterium fontis]
MVNRLAEIVHYKLNKNIDVNAVDYLRFINHLRYFAERVIARKIAPGHADNFYQELLTHYPDAMAISWAIRDYVQEKYHVALPKEELTWLTIHISRLATSQTP